MNKKIVTVVMIALMSVLIFSTALQNALALGPTGICYSEEDYEANQQHFPRYNECEHTNPEQPNDMMVGLGQSALYNLNSGTPVFNWANWTFLNQAGYSQSETSDSPVQIYPPMICTFCLDYGEPTQYYYNYPDPDYPTWDQVGDYHCWQARVDSAGYIDDWHSVQGMTQGVFYYLIFPWYTYYYFAYTQDEDGDHGFTFLTAHHGDTWW